MCRNFAVAVVSSFAVMFPPNMATPTDGLAGTRGPQYAKQVPVPRKEQHPSQHDQETPTRTGEATQLTVEEGSVHAPIWTVRWKRMLMVLPICLSMALSAPSSCLQQPNKPA